jgi:hypothetical protein
MECVERPRDKLEAARQTDGSLDDWPRKLAKSASRLFGYDPIVDSIGTEGRAFLFVVRNLPTVDVGGRPGALALAAFGHGNKQIADDGRA